MSSLLCKEEQTRSSSAPSTARPPVPGGGAGEVRQQGRSVRRARELHTGPAMDPKDACHLVGGTTMCRDPPGEGARPLRVHALNRQRLPDGLHRLLEDGRPQRRRRDRRRRVELGLHQRLAGSRSRLVDHGRGHGGVLIIFARGVYGGGQRRRSLRERLHVSAAAATLVRRQGSLHLAEGFGELLVQVGAELPWCASEDVGDVAQAAQHARRR
mmetsp:Transcript_47160/g.135120  ORF Transcript_47160/g.135120 Transcript_47160/m.135120 type:complete len:213 (+) Transcript_47160:101-739(+)